MASSLTRMATFTKLPTELAQLVFSNLDEYSDIASVRLVCKKFLAFSLQTFIRIHFGRLRTDLTAPNLEKLVKIGDHEDYRLGVTELLVRGPPYSDIRTLDLPLGHPPGQGDDMVHSDPEKDLARTLTDLLTTKFVNCQSFTINDIFGISYSIVYSYQKILSPSDAIQCLFTIFAQRVVPVRRFTIKFEKPLSSVDAFNLSFSPKKSRHFQRGWCDGLKELHLEYRTSMKSHMTFAVDLVLAAVNLEVLTFKVTQQRTGNLFDNFAKVLHIPKIKSLTLSNLNIDIPSESLLDLIRKLKRSLTYLHLERITFYPGSWEDFLTEFRSLELPLEHLTIKDAAQLIEAGAPGFTYRDMRCLLFCSQCYRSGPNPDFVSLYRPQNHRSHTASLQCQASEMDNALGTLQQMASLSQGLWLPSSTHICKSRA